MSERSPANVDVAVTSYYDKAPEETRLSFGSAKLEELRTRELIVRHAPKQPAIVYDIGGAAGAYAFWLSELGYEVHLFDASLRLVDVALARNATSPLKLASCNVADARSIQRPNESADIVLLLGPLYHLVEGADRGKALAEAYRLLRPHGVVIAAGISHCASALDGLSRELLGDERFMRIVERDLDDGNHLNPTDRVDYFTTAYFHRPDDLRREVTDAGFVIEGLYGVEGPAWILPDFDERWKDGSRREMMVKVARMLECVPSAMGASAHLLAVGRKSQQRSG